MTEGTGNGEMAQEDGSEATSVMGDEGDRCPICLSALAQRVLAVPSCCTHLFCLRCILRWAEMVPSCPVDRRLFSVIYTRDPVLGFIRIPVKTKNSRTDLETCHCKKEAEKEDDRGLSSGRIKKLARMFPVRGKDVQKKCDTGTCRHNLRSFAVRRKKLKREPCGAWALDSYPACPVLGAGQSASLTRELAELVVDYEQRPSLLLHKHWRSELQEHVQQPATAALAADGLSWRSLGALEARSGVSPLGFPVPGPAAVPLPVTRWFAFQGKACAVSCTRGKEKKGTRTTGSKGLKGKTEKPPTRTTRNRAQELPPVQDPCSSQSSHSDSNSSLPNQSPDTSGGSTSNRKPAGKRKPRQVGKQEECLKRNTRLRRRALEDARSSPEECGGGDGDDDDDDDDDDEGQQSLCHQDDGEDGKEAQGLDSQVFNCEQTLSADTGGLTQDSGKNLCSNTSDHSSGQEDLKDTAGDTLAISDDDTKNNSSEDEMEMVHQVHESDEISLQIPSHQEIQNEDYSIVLDGDKPIGDKDLERSSPGSSPSQDEVELESPSRSTVSPNANQLEDAEDKDSANAETVMTVKSNEGEPSEELDLSSEGYIKCQDIKMAEGNYEEEQGNEASPKVTDTMKKEGTSKEMCEDNMEMVPMDCDSPSTSHGELQSESDKWRTGGISGSVGDTSSSQASDEGKKPLQGSQEVCVEQKSHTVSRQRKSRFHSPSTTWSPKESKQERDRSRSKSRDNVSSQKDPKGERRRSRSRSRSRGRDRSRNRDRNGSWSSRHKSRDYSRDGENDRDGQKNEDYRRNRNRDRNSRRRSRTRSRSNSRSRSLPRNRAYGRSLSSERTEPGGRSPRRRDRWGDEEWRNTRESYQSRRHDQDKPSFLSGKDVESSNNGGITESSSPDQAKQENPDWVKEKMKSDSEVRGKPRGTNAHQWEDGFSNGAGDSWARGAPPGGWDADRRRSTGWNQRGSQQKGDSEQNRWQSRNACSSGTSNHSGNDSYSRFNENRLNRRPMEQEPPEHPVDRSGWSSASSWAVCRTLPADVQDYYSRRGRGSSASGGGWNRHNEEKSVQDTPPGEPSAQGNRGPQPPVTLLQRPQLSLAVQSPVVQPVAPLLPFPVGGHPQALKLPSAPFAVPHQVPLFLHPPMPLIQVPVTASQGLPPPPPPPPPAQQADSQSVQKAAIGSIAHGTNRPSAPLSSSLPKAPGGTVQGAPGPAQPSSTTQPRPSDRHHVDTHVDSSKKEKKLQIQEKAIHEVKAAMKPYYQNKDITKEEYKEIVRKAVEKVCHSKSGEVNSGKVANLVKAYVEKYKHDRKNKSEDSSK